MKYLLVVAHHDDEVLVLPSINGVRMATQLTLPSCVQRLRRVRSSET